MSFKMIHDDFWNDPRVRALPWDGKGFFAYLITNPHAHYSGVYRLHPKDIREETGLSPKEIQKWLKTLQMGVGIGLLDRVSDRGKPFGFVVEYDPERHVIFVINMLKRQTSKDGTVHLNEKQRKGITNYFATIGNTPLIGRFLEYWSKLGIETPKGYQIPLPDTPTGKGSPEGVSDIQPFSLSALQGTKSSEQGNPPVDNPVGPPEGGADGGGGSLKAPPPPAPADLKADPDVKRLGDLIAERRRELGIPEPGAKQSQDTGGKPPAADHTPIKGEEGERDGHVLHERTRG